MESAPRFSQWLSCSACCAVQSDSGSGGSVALLQMNAVLRSVGTDAALSRPRSFLSSHCSFLLSSHTCLCSKPPVISVCSYSFECAQISFTNNFEAKVRPSCWSSSNGKLAVQYVLRNSSVLHAAYMAKPAQPSLNEQGEHAR